MVSQNFDRINYLIFLFLSLESANPFLHQQPEVNPHSVTVSLKTTKPHRPYCASLWKGKVNRREGLMESQMFVSELEVRFCCESMCFVWGK